jgi:menaquinol-cytochrome c reductase iron-sulfur subunit
MQRRRFFKWASLILGGLYVLFAAIPGIGLLMEPLRRRNKRGAIRRLVKLADLETGVPRKVIIRDRRTDAWTRYPEGPIGAVWMIRKSDQQVDVFSETCPHLGCPVEHLAAERKFFCPCHEGLYGDDGSIVSGPQQRGLDRLETRIETAGGVAWVGVVFERFELGTQEKVSLG